MVTRKFILKERPSLGSVSTVMIGIRNNKRGGIGAKGRVLWVNEIRLSDIENDAVMRVMRV